tara:strand:- start:647 stop:1372 length:726 start_codon:yes stop_codon:yes gene_type:complete
MDILILAAGFGTRLYPLTKNTPKALIPINNKPLINYTIERINQIPEIETIYILSNNKFSTNFLKWKDNFKHLTNKKIKILNNGVNHESESKGVLRDLQHTLNIIKHDELLILGSDNLYCFDLNKIIKIAKEKQTSVNALKAIDKELIKKYGCVLLDENNKIINFQEKPENPKSNLASIFCYYLIKKDLDNIKIQESFKVENIIEHLYNNFDIHTYYFKEPWFDIGSLEELKNAEEFLSNSF